MHVGAQYVRSLKHLWAPCSIHFHPIFLLSHPIQHWPFWWMTMVSQATGPPNRQKSMMLNPDVVPGGGFFWCLADWLFFTKSRAHQTVWCTRYTWWLVVSNIFYYHPCLGKISNLTNIFQRGWNHQVVGDWWIQFRLQVLDSSFNILSDHRGCTLSRLDLGLLFEQCIKPWLVRLYRGL